jgi:hypothetical protein
MHKIEVYNIWAEDLFKWFYDHVMDSCGDGAGTIVCANYKECEQWFIQWCNKERLPHHMIDGYIFGTNKTRYEENNHILYSDGNENFTFSKTEEGHHNDFHDYVFVVKSDLEFAQDYPKDGNNRLIKAIKC